MNDVNLDVDENNSLVDVLNDPKKEEVFLEQIDKLVKEKVAIKAQQQRNLQKVLLLLKEVNAH